MAVARRTSRTPWPHLFPFRRITPLRLSSLPLLTWLARAALVTTPLAGRPAASLIPRPSRIESKLRLLAPLPRRLSALPRFTGGVGAVGDGVLTAGASLAPSALPTWGLSGEDGGFSSMRSMARVRRLASGVRSSVSVLAGLYRSSRAMCCLLMRASTALSGAKETVDAVSDSSPSWRLHSCQ